MATETARRCFAPTTLESALALRAREPQALLVNGATDLAVDMNFGRRSPASLIDLSRVRELREWSVDGDRIRIGAGVTFATLTAPPFDELLAALAEAARTVGSPQIRNRATIGGNLGTGSPAGDAIPPLVAVGAEVVLAGEGGARRMPVEEFFLGPKRSRLGPAEIITAVEVRARDGRQTFMKIGPRNAMVISVASLAVAVHGTEIRAAWGSAGPVVAGVTLPLGEARALPQRVREACSPIDDVRGSAEYRRHALGVLASRALDRCLT
jgi:CO/xanthine dehydrogenase FAD-binding subunit